MPTGVWERGRTWEGMVRAMLSNVLVNQSTGCWLWQGSRDSWGYGHIKHNGRYFSTHRLSWMVHNGPIEKMQVLHSCDVRNCINPDHLFLGTQKDNLADMAKKGRGSFGENHWKTSLTEQQVISIRADKRLQREIAQDFCISPKSVGAIQKGRSWKFTGEVVGWEDKRRKSSHVV
jgi:hypothetical protein